MTQGAPPDPLLSRLREAVLEPRRSMRRGLEQGWSEGDRLLMVAAWGLVNALFLRLLAPFSPQLRLLTEAMAQGGGLYVHLALGTLMVYGLLFGLIHGSGMLVGGRADFAQSRSTAAWWMLVSAALTPFTLIPFLGIFVFFGSFALLAVYVHEAQGFKSLRTTMTVTSFLALTVMTLLSSVVVMQAAF